MKLPLLPLLLKKLKKLPLNKQQVQWFPGPPARAVLSFAKRLEEMIPNG